MEKREKRIVSWLLALLMALSLLSPGALALEPEEPEEPENSPAGESLPGTDSGQSNETLEPSGEAARRCTLHLTHTLRWKTPEGQGPEGRDGQDEHRPGEGHLDQCHKRLISSSPVGEGYPLF